MDSVDELVATARKFAERLNETLDALAALGVATLGVVGAPHDPGYASGQMRELTRVSLCLEFKPKKAE